MVWKKKSRWGWESHYPRSTPHKAEGGIKSQSKGGTFGKSWWAKRWVQVLESFSIGARLSRGRSYARGGQVLSIAIEKGTVLAKVQGSRPTPYTISIELGVLSEGEWTKVINALGQQVLFAAKLLAGEMPQDIEPVFKEVGVSLFPTKLDDLKTSCSCPDWSNPCKHIAAAYYLLGEEFDRDPFLIFRLRGMEREALMTRLARTGTATEAAPAKARPSEPLSAVTELFWTRAEGKLDVLGGVIEIPREPASLPKRLGGFPFWQGESPFLDSMSPVYAAASPRGLDLFLATATEGKPIDTR